MVHCSLYIYTLDQLYIRVFIKGVDILAINNPLSSVYNLFPVPPSGQKNLLRIDYEVRDIIYTALICWASMLCPHHCPQEHSAGRSAARKVWSNDTAAATAESNSI